MKKNINKNVLSKTKLIVWLSLLVMPPCSFVSAQDEFTPLNHNIQNIELTPIIASKSTIHLDSSSIDHPILHSAGLLENSNKQKTTLTPINNDSYLIKSGQEFIIPDSVEGSTIDSNLLPTSVDPYSFPSPSEYKSRKIINAFEPPSPENETQSEIFADNKNSSKDTTNKEKSVEVFYPEDSEQTPQFASVEEHDISDFDGKIISEIRFKGLDVISENSVLQRIKTGSGCTFSEERLQEDLQRIYNSGYFTDSMSIEPELKDDGTVKLTFVLEENVYVSDVSIIGNTVFSTAELMPFVSNLKGQPQNLNLINDSIEKINQYYKDRGYILASVTSVDDTPDGKLSLSITEGIIDKILIEGNNKTKEYVMWRNIMTAPGVVYNEDYIKKDITRLYSTQIFEEVDRKITPSEEKEGEYVVTVQVKEGSSNSVSIGGGIDSGLGLFGSVGYHEKNLFGRGQRLSLTGMVGSGILLSDASVKNRMNFNLELSFFEPYFLNADTSLASKLYYRDLGSYQIPLAIERRFGLNNVVEHKVKGYNNLKTSLGFGYEHISLSEGNRGEINRLYKLNGLDISRRAKQLTGGSFLNITPGIKYSTLDDDIMPREGIVAKANFMESFGLSNIEHTTGRLIGSVKKYFKVGKKSTFSIGAKGGIKVHGSDMPEVMAFRLGGPYSVRGYKINGVGTGEHFLMGSAELLTPIPFMDRFKYDILKNMRFAFFADAGKIFDPTISSKLYDRPLEGISVGMGIRIFVPGVGPISIDYGVPITNVGNYGHRGGYFTFGTGGMFDGGN